MCYFNDLFVEEDILIGRNINPMLKICQKIGIVKIKRMLSVSIQEFNETHDFNP